MNNQQIFDAVSGVDLDHDFAHDRIVEPLSRALSQDPAHFEDAFLDSLSELSGERFDELTEAVLTSAIVLAKSHERELTAIEATVLTHHVTKIGSLVFLGWMDAVQSHVRNNADTYLDIAKRAKRDAA